MLVIDKFPTAEQLRALGPRRRDTLVMTCEERRWLRRRTVTAAGRAIALALPTGSRIAPGTIIAVEQDWYLEVEGAVEAVLAVHPRSRDEAVRLAFEIGNHHFALAIQGDDLLVTDDSAMTQLLTRLGASWERRQAVFDPIGKGGQHAT
jgi:urease accessory protein UreE